MLYFLYRKLGGNRLNQRIKLRRKNMRLTQSELAKRINVSPQVVSNWERSYTTPSSEDIKRLAEALDCTADFLLGNTDDPDTVTPEEEFNSFISDPDLQVWYQELPKSSEEELRQLKDIWEVIKKEKKQD